MTITNKRHSPIEKTTSDINLDGETMIQRLRDDRATTKDFPETHAWVRLSHKAKN